MQLNLVGPLEDGGVDHHSAVEGVVLEARMHVEFVAIWQDLRGQATLGDEFLFLRQVDGSARSCAL